MADQVVQQTTNPPDWVAKGGQDLFNIARSIAQRDFPTYQGPRIAPFTQNQQTAANLLGANIGSWQPNLGLASQTAAGVARSGISPITVPEAPLRQQATPASISPITVSAGSVPIRQQSAVPNVTAGYAPVYQQTQIPQVEVSDVPIRQQAATAPIDPNNVSGYSRLTYRGPGSSWDQTAQDQYLNPYVQSIIDEINRQTDIQIENVGLQRAAQGAWGGSGQALQEAELRAAAARNAGLARAQAWQEGFNMYDTDQRRQQTLDALAAQLGMNAALANQTVASNEAGRNLQAALGVDEGNANRALQAVLASAGLIDTAQGRNLAAAMQGGQFNVTLPFQAALANQNTQNTIGGRNLAAALGADQINVQLPLQAALANQSAGLQAGIANQNTQNTVGGRNLQAGMATDQFNIGNILQTQLLNNQLGLQSGNQQLSAASLLGNLGQIGSNLGMQDFNALWNLGTQEQNQNQQNLNLAYNDFLREFQYPQENLNMLLSTLRGVPYSQSSTSISPGPNDTANILSTLLALAGITGKQGFNLWG